MTTPLWMVPCIECGRERCVTTAVWAAWVFPCDWCANILTPLRWVVGLDQEATA